MKTIKIFVGLLMILGLNSCSENSSEISDEVTNYVFVSNEQIQANAMVIGFPETHEFVSSLSLTGYVRAAPSAEHDINTFVSGFVKEIKVNPGDYVKKGAVIAILEHPDIIELQQKYAIALSRFSYLENELERMTSLQKNEVIAKKELNKVRADFEAARAEFNSLHVLVNLVGLSPSAISRGEIQAHLPIRAIESGWIAQVNVRSGELVTAENPVATLIDESGLQIELAVFEKDYGQINIGQQIFFTVPGSDEEMKATIVRKGMEIDDERGATVYAEFSDTLKNRGVTYGSFVSANVVQHLQSSFALPPTAAVDKGEGYRALRVVQKTADGYELEEVYMSGIKSNDGWYIVPNYSPNSSQEYLLKGVFDLLSE